jgi:thiamine-phosphate pyrophosphorylase
MSEVAMRPLRGLYAITPEGLASAILLERVEAALAGGVALVQYRDKSSDAGQRSATARALRALCQRFDARLIVNDDLALALAVDADGVHLGGADGDLGAARQALGPSKLLGASCYADFALAQHAVAVGADYVAFGAVYASPTKPLAPSAPWSLFRRYRNEVKAPKNAQESALGYQDKHIPACAIGGITLANAPPLLAAGADLLAVISDLFEAPDIRLRAADFQRLFEEK